MKKCLRQSICVMLGTLTILTSAGRGNIAYALAGPPDRGRDVELLIEGETARTVAFTEQEDREQLVRIDAKGAAAAAEQDQLILLCIITAYPTMLYICHILGGTQCVIGALIAAIQACTTTGP